MKTSGWLGKVSSIKYGVVYFPTDQSVRIDDMARDVEERGFESLWLPEHTHIPCSRRSPYPLGDTLPRADRSEMTPAPSSPRNPAHGLATC